ncbi:MAG TPA: J domain-containing protein [Rhodanobacter sp.]|nr:J domain-containing protein [Rhodanobacter sp.]
MSPFEQLGLPADADERMVKRAYAQRLRDTRPDADPEGFQRLHEIYQAALTQCRRGMVVTGIQRKPERKPVASADDVSFATANAQQETAAFRFEDFSAEALALAASGDAAQLKTWLEEQPALWSLRMKTRVGHELFAQLQRDTPPASPACIEVLLAFFDMNQAGAGHDALRQQRLLRRMQLAWELQPAHSAALAERMEMRLHSELCELERNLDRLARSLHWRLVARIGLEPYEASSYTQFIQKLSMNHPEDLPETCDRNQIRFWLEAAAQGRVNKARLRLGAIRCTAVLLAGVLLGLLSGALMRLAAAPFNWTTFWVCIALPAVPCALWGLAMLALPLDSWHTTPEYQPVRWPWLNLLLVPLLCATALAFGEANAYIAAFVSALAALWLAFRRLRRRNTTPWRFSPRLIWFGLWGLFMLAKSMIKDTDSTYADITYPALVAATAMLIWGTDIWRQRHGLRVRNGMSG